MEGYPPSLGNLQLHARRERLRHMRVTQENAWLQALFILELYPCGDAGLAAVGVALEVNILMLEGAPQPFDEQVVHPAAAAIHGDLDPGRKRAGEGRADELRALIGVENLRSAVSCQGVVERRQAERGVSHTPETYNG